MKTPSRKIPLLDLTGLTAFQRLHGNRYEMVMQGNRGVAMFEADETFYELAEKFNRNEPVQVIDFIQAQREVKAELMTLKRGHSENVKGYRYESFNR
jgi:hypothetical protein